MNTFLAKSIISSFNSSDISMLSIANSVLELMVVFQYTNLFNQNNVRSGFRLCSFVFFENCDYYNDFYSIL